MRQLKYIHAVLAVLASWALVSCTIDERYPVVGERESVVTFTPVLSGDMQTRAIGDATMIDQLVVCVFEGSTQVLRQDLPWDEVSSGVSVTLIEGRTYNILFWAQCEDNGAYEIHEDGSISVTYDSFQTGGFSAMEKMDAFYAVVTDVKIGSAANQAMGTITLTRPLAQVNFADNATAPVQGEHRSVVTFQNYPTSFDPFTGSVGVTTDELVFTFTDFPGEPLSSGGVDYHYLSCNYFFAMTDSQLSATLEFQTAEGSTTIKTVSVQEVPLEPNKKTNVIGSIVQEPETWSVWDGSAEPETVPALDQDRYIIDEAADIAWLGVNASTLQTGKTFLLTIDIDMAKKSGLSSIQLPSGSTLDGQKHTIRGVRLAGALFGDATELTMRNLTLEDVQVSSPDSHAGVLVNTLKGTGSFSGIHIINSSVESSEGAAGGLVGYVVRKSANERSEALEVVFDDCRVDGSSVTGSLAQGHFVGLLRGYDAGEVLRFNDNCTYVATTSASLATGPVSPYCEGNEGAWLAANDYSPFNGWLGNEECYRGQVFYGTQRFIPRWDGTTKIEPLLADATYDANVTPGTNRYVVYSAYDLAGLRNKTAAPAALYLMQNVDMFGQGEDGEFFVHSNFTKSACNSVDDNNFDAFTSIALLEGNNKGIYNVALNSKGSDRYAFILNGDNGHIHKNVSFHNCCTVVPHVVNDNEDKSYGATVVLAIGGATYTMENVHAYGCKVFALQKTGIIAGRVVSSTMATITNCTVNDCYIENYDCKDHAEQFGNSLVSTTFYTPGEVGGFIGFVENFATISNCHVKGTTIYAFGQNNKRVLLIYTVYGRHVGQFIGDIHTTDYENDKIVLTNCSVDSNTKCTKRWDKHGKCNMIGCVYYLPFMDSKGTVTLDGKSIF